MRTEELAIGGLRLRPPKPREFGYLTTLRNRERHWFGDQRQLEAGSAAAWLAARNENDQLLCIESEGLVVGTIGWVKVSSEDRTYEIGRIIFDRGVVRSHQRGQHLLRNVTRLAAILAFDHLFSRLRADAVYARNRSGNSSVRKLIQDFGLEAVTWPYTPSEQPMECWRIDAAAWGRVRERLLMEFTPGAGEA